MATYTITERIDGFRIILRLPTVDNTISNVHRFREIAKKTKDAEDKELYHHCVESIFTHIPKLLPGSASLLDEVKPKLETIIDEKDYDAKVDDLITQIQQLKT